MHSSDYICVVHLCHRKCNPFFSGLIFLLWSVFRQCTICAPRTLYVLFRIFFVHSPPPPIPFSYRPSSTSVPLLFAQFCLPWLVRPGEKCVSSFSSARLNAFFVSQGLPIRYLPYIRTASHMCGTSAMWHASTAADHMHSSAQILGTRTEIRQKMNAHRSR